MRRPLFVALTQWSLAALLAIAAGAPGWAAVAQTRPRYFVVWDAPTTFSQASEICMKAGGTLPIISNAKDQRELMIVITSELSFQGYNSTSLITYLNGWRQGTCSFSTMSPGCTFEMERADGTLMSLYRGTTPVPGVYANWRQGYPVNNRNLTVLGIQRNGQWVNVAPIPPAELPKGTVCYAHPKKPKSMWWIMIVMFSVLMAVGAVVWCVCRKRLRAWVKPPTDELALAFPESESTALTASSTESQLVSESTTILDDSSTHSSTLSSDDDDDDPRSMVERVRDAAYEAALPYFPCRLPNTQSSNNMTPLAPLWQEVFDILEFVPVYQPEMTAASNPILLLRDRRGVPLKYPPGLLPIALLESMYAVRKANGEPEEVIGRWTFRRSRPGDPSTGRRWSYHRKLAFIEERLPPPWPGVPHYFSRTTVTKKINSEPFFATDAGEEDHPIRPQSSFSSASVASRSPSPERLPSAAERMALARMEARRTFPTRLTSPFSEMAVAAFDGLEAPADTASRT